MYSYQRASSDLPQDEGSSQDGHPDANASTSTTSLPFDYDGLYDNEVVIMGTFSAWYFPSPYDLGPYELVLPDPLGTEDQWQLEGGDWGHASESQASSSRTHPLVNDTPSDSSVPSPWCSFDDEPYVGTTVDPRDVCDISAASTYPSIDHTVDEEKPIHDYRGSPSPPIHPASGNLDSDLYSWDSEAEEDRASRLEDTGCNSEQSMTHYDGNLSPCKPSSSPITRWDPRASSPIPSQSRSSLRHTALDLEVQKMSEYNHEDDRDDPDYVPEYSTSIGFDTSTTSNLSAASSSSSIRGIKRSCTDGYEDTLDIHGDHQIVKTPRTDGRVLCPFSRCDAHFGKVGERVRHIKSKPHLNILKRKCPKPNCLFEGSRPDTYRRHLRAPHGCNELGHCTCGAQVCIRARRPQQARRSKRARME